MNSLHNRNNGFSSFLHFLADMPSEVPPKDEWIMGYRHLQASIPGKMSFHNLILVQTQYFILCIHLITH